MLEESIVRDIPRWLLVFWDGVCAGSGWERLEGCGSEIWGIGWLVLEQWLGNI